MTQTEWRFDSPRLLDVLLKNWLFLGLISLAAFVIAVFISLSITPRFKSTLILYPVEEGSFSSELFELNYSNKDLLRFGDEESTEKLIQVLNSQETLEHMAERFDLAAHYEIPEDSRYRKTLTLEKLSSNMTIKKTEYQSVRIEILDTDPQMAYAIAREFERYTDSAFRQILSRRMSTGFALIEKEFQEEEALLRAYEDSLDYLAAKGIVDVEGQSQGIYRAYAAAIEQNNGQLIRKLEQQIASLEQYGGMYHRIHMRYALVADRYKSLRGRYEQLKADRQMSLPHIFTVSEPVLAEKKARPKRSVIVLAFTISTFLFSLIVLLVLASVKKVSLDAKAK